MKKLTLLLLAFVVLAFPAMATQVYVDFDKNADFAKYETFKWYETGDDLSASDPLGHSRVVNAIEHYLTQGDDGLIEVTEGPDLWITYHTSVKQETQVNTTHYGYGYGGGWGWDPYWGGGMGMGMDMGGSTSQVVTYDVGTLMIDIIDAEKKELIWRGSATNVFSEKPEKFSKQIDKALRKIVHKYQKEYVRLEKQRQ